MLLETASRPDAVRPLAIALLIAVAVTGLRLVLLAYAQHDIFVDEAQYWLWGQTPEFGYYSKPPLIGWLIGSVTWLAGSDAPFWLRAPAPVLHGITAVVLAAIAERYMRPGTGPVVAIGYLTLPMVALGSLVISTDTVMFPFLALALLMWLRALDEGGPAPAVCAGLALGAAFMAKYAALYYLLSAVLAALAPWGRPRAVQAGAALAAFAVVIAPNVIWNAANGFKTVEHTALDNMSLEGGGAALSLNPDDLAEFFGAQFVVFGPVALTLLLILALRWPRRSELARLLLIFALPPLVMVSIQALLSRAYANWAVAAYLPASVLVFAVLLRHRFWLATSFAFAVFFAIALPLMTLWPSGLPEGLRRAAMDRYIGRDEMSVALIEAARSRGLDTIVSDDRDTLADLFYTGRDAGLAYRSVPAEDRVRHHYQQRYPINPGAGDVLYVSRASRTPPCPAEPVEVIAPRTGAYRKLPQAIYVLPASCWAR